MSTTGEIIRKMILSQAKGDKSGFRTAVVEYVEEERRKNHHILARDIERLLQNGANFSDLTGHLNLIGTHNNDLPRDKERSILLVEIKEPKRSLESLVLTNELRKQLELIIRENHKSEVLHTYGLRPISKVLFCGPPGCGKSVGAEAVAEALSLPIVLVRFDAVVSSYLGETAANLRKVFDFAMSRPMVILFDEFDAIGKHRTDEEEHGELKRVVNSFLQMLDSFGGETLIIAATNHQGLLDSALWRRFDEIVFFDRPNLEAIEKVLRQNVRQIGIESDINLTKCSGELVGLSHADAERIALQAVKATVLANCKTISSDTLKESIESQKKRIVLTREIAESSHSHDTIDTISDKNKVSRIRRKSR
jgi:SpoVK/Ycf46/Vps4 family AAA+-type ATPase